MNETDVVTGPEQPALPETPPDALPRQVGRYRILAKLGSGGFGVVYRAYDGELRRDVAIKVPHRNRVSRPEDVEAYLAEARVLAALDHPHVVPVYDAGRTDDGLCFAVSKFIEGSNLGHRIGQGRPSFTESADLIATVAEALHHAHRKGIVHRDVKPGNILLDAAGKPYLADFGQALKDKDFGKGAHFTGTPAYMSPEQASGEGHRVDGRSDVFSLGVVFYELLTGRRPFQGETAEELLDEIVRVDARPPRQTDDAIAKELERVCLKALAKRASERYTTAGDMADDLRHFLGQATEQERPAGRAGAAEVATPTPAWPATPTPTPRVKVVPKGLRSFDAQDADFFLELLPGPRDRDGLPDNLRFWKTRIEETDPDNTFTVGLLYGPSGCGKSSLVKAGLLPRLAPHVTAVYLEATAEDTKARLLKGLRRHCPDLPGDLGLVEALAELRRGRGVPGGRKVLLVLDQFEQWLHAERGEEDTGLVQALRQCDGSRVQALVMVRDDFWLAVSRFMADLEVELLQGRNMALVDLFDPRHARKVLAAFGRAFGALPEGQGKLPKDQAAFLDQAVAGLAQDGKVISVRLALFAEMVKGKPWTPATLREVGGTAGVGVTFLEETFSASTAPPQHRLHQKAAQAVLKALLPETGTDIKGHMRSREDLLEASGYGSRPRDFEALLHILDGELRLITPTEPEGVAPEGQSSRAGERYYQLTHDYLVHSLRDWLTRKQKETRRGRAELLLADRAAVWNARPENRQLPSWWEWANVRLFTRKRDWTPPQEKMLRKATRYHAVRGLAVALVLALLGWGGYEGHGGLQARALRDRLLDAHTTDVPAIVQDMARYRRWLDPLLNAAHAQARKDNDRRKQLHTSLALLPVDASQVEYLKGRLLNAEPEEVSVIRDALLPHKDQLLDELWGVVEAPETNKESQRLRAAAALAAYDPESDRWARCGALVVNDLVRENSVYLLYWSEAYRPVKESFCKPLAAIFRDQRPDRVAERRLAASLLADYAADSPHELADLLLDADDKQFAVIFAKFKEQGAAGSRLLAGEIARELPAEMHSSDGRRERLAKRQVNAAVALLRMGHPGRVWPLLRRTPPDDPRVRSYLIHRLGPLGGDAGAVIQRLEEEPDVAVRRALLLSLGEFTETELPPTARTALLPKVQALYRTDADPGLHAAAEWLLRAWQQDPWLDQVNDMWAKDSAGRDKRLQSIRQLVREEREKAPPRWYVNGQGQTLVVIPGPAEFLMGSAPAENRGMPSEPRHRRRIGRTFAIAAKPVTVREFRPFLRETRQEERLGAFWVNMMKRHGQGESCPMTTVNWYMAAAYCNWLSKKEGIPEEQWCYETNAQGDVTALKAAYLSLQGYRLPTEPEWEYACRAGAVTSRYYGETEELLPRYGWYIKNSGELSWPVGRKKPNDLGLFDMYGNVRTWCQESFMGPYPTPKEGVLEDKEDVLQILPTAHRMVRGGSLTADAGVARSASRGWNVPAERAHDRGLRPARTFR
jgi:formylglycine-generating enzyme required for sulfatase activity